MSRDGEPLAKLERRTARTIGPAGNLAIDKGALELLSHLLGSIGAHAHQPDATCGQSLDGGNADFSGKAFGDDHGLVEGHKEDPAQSLSP